MSARHLNLHAVAGTPTLPGSSWRQVLQLERRCQQPWGAVQAGVGREGPTACALWLVGLIHECGIRCTPSLGQPRAACCLAT